MHLVQQSHGAHTHTDTPKLQTCQMTFPSCCILWYFSSLFHSFPIKAIQLIIITRIIIIIIATKRKTTTTTIVKIIPAALASTLARSCWGRWRCCWNFASIFSPKLFSIQYNFYEIFELHSFLAVIVLLLLLLLLFSTFLFETFLFLDCSCRIRHFHFISFTCLVCCDSTSKDEQFFYSFQNWKKIANGIFLYLWQAGTLVYSFSNVAHTHTHK